MGQRYPLIDRESLIELFGIQSMDEVRKIQRDWVTEALEKQSYRERQPRWNDSIAFMSEAFVRDRKERLGTKAMWREIVGANGT